MRTILFWYGASILVASADPLSGSLRHTGDSHHHRGRERRLFSWGQESEFIWGRCEAWARNFTGCTLTQGSQCTDYLSEGPEDADVEIVLGNLPPSTTEEVVHLQWFAPRGSPVKWDPFSSPVGCGVYWYMDNAYPKYYEPAFNGGNVRVDEAGTATIRVRAPSTYFILPYIAVPHVHLRLCKGGDFVNTHIDDVYFGIDTQVHAEIWAVTGSQTEPIEVLDAHRYAPDSQDNSSRLAYVHEGPDPTHVIAGVFAESGVVLNVAAGPTTDAIYTTTTPQRTTTTGEPTTTTAQTMTKAPTTTTMPLQHVQINAAKDALDLDALEFSPVYSCLANMKYFDHISEDCAEACPKGTVVAHGQCVRRPSEKADAVFEVLWTLDVRCGKACWVQKQNTTLHLTRLQVAAHLDIPFQEVQRVAIAFEDDLLGRRLEEMQTAHLHINVSTRRMSAHFGAKILADFLPNASWASGLLGMDVRGLSLVVEGQAPESIASAPGMGNGTDPYERAYSVAEKNAPPPKHDASDGLVGASALDVLPEWAVITLALTILVAAAVGLGIRYYRRWKFSKMAETAVTVIGKLEEDEFPKKQKGAWAPTKPTEPQTTAYKITEPDACVNPEKAGEGTVAWG